MAVFEFLRLSLGRPEQGDLLGSDGRAARPISRREYLERVFSKPQWDFAYYGSNYSFLKDGIYNNTLVGRIGKQVIEPIHRGPDQGYAIEMVEDWKPVWMLLDLASDSQLIALQSGIASPKRLVRALFDRIESSSPAIEYEAFIEYVSDPQEFWKAVDEYRGQLTRLEFTFVPPNALGLEEKIKAIVEAAKGVGSEKTKFTHTNREGGLDPKEGEYVKAALKATSEGAGSVALKAGRRTVFSSEKNRRKVDVPSEEIPVQRDDAAIKKLVERLREEKS